MSDANMRTAVSLNNEAMAVCELFDSIRLFSFSWWASAMPTQASSAPL